MKQYHVLNLAEKSVMQQRMKRRDAVIRKYKLKPTRATYRFLSLDVLDQLTRCKSIMAIRLILGVSK